MIRMWQCASDDSDDDSCNASDPCEDAPQLGCGYVEFADLAALLTTSQLWFGCQGWDCEAQVGDEYDGDGNYRPLRKPQWLPSESNDGTGSLFCSVKCLRHTKAQRARAERARRDWLRCSLAIWPESASVTRHYDSICGQHGDPQSPMLPRGKVITPTYSWEAALGVEVGHEANCNIYQWATAVGRAPLDIRSLVSDDDFAVCLESMRAWVKSEDRPARGVFDLWNATQRKLGLLARWAPKVEK